MGDVIMRRSLVQWWIDNNFVTLICLFIEKLYYEQNFIKQHVTNFHQLSEPKGFIPPLPLIAKIIWIVFEEIVSCQMEDALTSINRSDENYTVVLYEGPKLRRNFHMISARITLLRSILLRGHYGRNGVWHANACSLRSGWRFRFSEVRIPVNILIRINESFEIMFPLS